MKLSGIIAIALGCFGASQVMFASKATEADPKSRLEFVIIEVNGEPQKVKPSEEVIAVLGDVVKIGAAVLVDTTAEVANVNLVGYQSGSAPRKGEDRGYSIKTDRDLIKSWSINHDGQTYRIRTSTGSVHHGDVYLKLISPKLKYAELLVNGRVRMVREGELLRLKKTDQISVKTVRTNIAEDAKKVDFQIVPNEQVELPGVKLYEIRFARDSKVFARIPMQVEGHELQ